MATISLDNSHHQHSHRQQHGDPNGSNHLGSQANANPTDLAYDTAVTDDVAIFVEDTVDDPAVALALTHSPVAVAMLSSPGATQRLQQQQQQQQQQLRDCSSSSSSATTTTISSFPAFGLTSYVATEIPKTLFVSGRSTSKPKYSTINNRLGEEDDDDCGMTIDVEQISSISTTEEIVDKHERQSGVTTIGRSNSMRGLASTDQENSTPTAPPPSSSKLANSNVCNNNNINTSNNNIFQTPPTKSMMNHYQRSYPLPPATSSALSHNSVSGSGAQQLESSCEWPALSSVSNDVVAGNVGLQALHHQQQQMDATKNAMAMIGTPSRARHPQPHHTTKAGSTSLSSSSSSSAGATGGGHAGASVAAAALLGKDASMVERVALRRFAQDRTNTPNNSGKWNSSSDNSPSATTPQKGGHSQQQLQQQQKQPPFLTSPSKFQHTDTTTTPNRYRNTNNAQSGIRGAGGRDLAGADSYHNTNHGVTAASSAFFASLMEKKLAAISNQFNHLNQGGNNDKPRSDTPSPSPQKIVSSSVPQGESDFDYDEEEIDDNEVSSSVGMELFAQTVTKHAPNTALSSRDQRKATSILSSNALPRTAARATTPAVTNDVSCSPFLHASQKEQQVMEKMAHEMTTLRKENSRLQCMYDHQKQLVSDADARRLEVEDKLQAKIMEAIGLASRLDESKRFVRQLKKESHENRVRTMNFANHSSKHSSGLLDESQIEKIIEPRISAAVRNVEMRYLAVIRDQQDRIQALEELLGSEECSMTKIAEASMVRNRRLVDEVSSAQKSEKLALERLVNLRRDHEDKIKEHMERHEQARDQLKASQRALASEREYVDELLSAIDLMRQEMDALKEDHEQLLLAYNLNKEKHTVRSSNSRRRHEDEEDDDRVSDDDDDEGDSDEAHTVPVSRQQVDDRHEQDEEIEFEIEEDTHTTNIREDDEDANSEIFKHNNRARSLSPSNPLQTGRADPTALLAPPAVPSLSS